jgi:Zn-dependent protease with chaperone function
MIKNVYPLIPLVVVLVLAKFLSTHAEYLNFAPALFGLLYFVSMFATCGKNCRTELRVIEKVYNYAKELGIACPATIIYESESINAYVSGSFNASTIFISSAGLKKLSERQFEAVVAHEVAHVALGHLFLRVMVLWAIGVSFSWLLFLSVSWAVLLVFVLICSLLVIINSITEEIQADKYSFRLTGHIGIVEFLGKYHSKTLYSRLRMWRLLKYVRA